MAAPADYRFVSRQRGAAGIVVFVHGLGGSMEKTWGRLPEFVARRAAPQFDVMLWSYPTSVIWNVPPVDAVGGLLVSRLKAVCPGYRDIVLVGHSLGCLVAESALVLQLRIGKGNEQREK